MPNKTFPFRIGADPEFSISTFGRQISAIKLLTSAYKNQYQNGNMGFKVPGAGEFGWDGCNALGELRPLPSHNPKTVAENIGKLIKVLHEKCGLFTINALSIITSVGGHVHFEIPEDARSSLGKIVHRLASCHIPLLLGENALSTSMRQNSSYGKFLDYRTNQFNDKNVLEFRAPSGEWITTPKIAESTLAYLGTVYQEALKNSTVFRKLSQIIIDSNKQADAMMGVSRAKLNFVLDAMLDKIKKNIINFERYPDFKEEIDFILNPKRVLAQKQRCQFNLFQGWGLDTNKLPHKRDFLSETKYKEKLAQVPDQVLTAAHENPQINCSDDINLPSLIENLTNHFAVWNFLPKYAYYFFGLREGVQEPILINNNRELLLGAQNIDSKENLKRLKELTTNLAMRVPINPQGISAKDAKNKAFAVGLPYKWRKNMDTKKVLGLVHDIERLTFQPIDLEHPCYATLPEKKTEKKDKIDIELSARDFTRNQHQNLTNIVNEQEPNPNQPNHYEPGEQTISEILRQQRREEQTRMQAETDDNDDEHPDDCDCDDCVENKENN